MTSDAVALAMARARVRAVNLGHVLVAREDLTSHWAVYERCNRCGSHLGIRRLLDGDTAVAGNAATLPCDPASSPR
jgi:hypothetical protein